MDDLKREQQDLLDRINEERERYGNIHLGLIYQYDKITEEILNLELEEIFNESN